MTQDVFLFHATLRENICYGVPDASREEVDAVVEAAQLRDLLDRLPDGLETVVGERGYRLSGGEKQRVAIARALLLQAPYLLLDEATSSLDSQAERRIQAALATLVEGRTVSPSRTVSLPFRGRTRFWSSRTDESSSVARTRALLRQSGSVSAPHAAQFSTDAAGKPTDSGDDTAGSSPTSAWASR